MKEIDPGACEFVPIAEAGEVGSGERIFVDIDDLSIVVFNIAGQSLAIGDVCSHDDGPVGEGDLEGMR
jgi:3-phenylpropionate/trans-cinnamate dioxygenase ferredoxin subunit